MTAAFLLAGGATHAATYPSWQAGHFTAGELADTAVSGEMADPDGDGMVNLMEYAFGLDPWVFTAGPSTLPSVVDGYLQLAYSRPSGISDLVYVPQVSTDLVSWQSGDNYVETVSSVDAGGVRGVVLQDYTYWEANRFMRLLVAKDDDEDSLPDEWEMQYFGNLDSLGTDDNDLDWLTNLQEYQQQTDPTDYYNGYAPQLTIASGGSQRGAPGITLPVPLRLAVNNGAGNAPVTLTVKSGQALLSDGSSAPATSVQVLSSTQFTTPQGWTQYVAQVQISLPDIVGDVSVIEATAGGTGYSASITTTASATDPSLQPPQNFTAVASSATTAQLSWTPSDAGQPTTIEMSTDEKATWTEIQTVEPGVTTASVEGLIPGMASWLRLYTGNSSNGGNAP